MDNKGKQPKVKIFMGKAKIKQQVGRSVDSQTLDWKIDIQPQRSNTTLHLYAR